MLAEHGQPVVLGGLIADNTALSRQGVPGVGDISIWGHSRPTVETMRKRNLQVLIRSNDCGSDADDVRRLSAATP